MVAKGFKNRHLISNKVATHLSSKTPYIITFIILLFAILIILPTSYPTGSQIVAPVLAEENSLATPKTMLDAKMLRELNHLPQENYAYVFHVLDWSPDGKFILFGYHDYADSSSSQKDSLGIIDAQTFNVTKLDVLDVNENNTQEIYLAKISPSSDSIFILMGEGGPEDIFRYDLTDRTLTRITNSSRIPWFDTVGLDDAQIAYIGPRGLRFWPVDNPELGNKIDALTGQYYVFLDHYSSSLRQGRLDVNDDASKVAIAAGPFDSRGIIYVDISSGKTSILQERTPCVSSVEFAPYDELLVYSEHPGQQCPFPLDADEWSAPLRVTSLDGTIDELLYLDAGEVLDVVLSPDGKYAASFGFGGTEEEDRSPKIMLLELPRPVPEFGSYLAIAMVAISIAGTIVATRLKVNWRR